MKPHKIGWLNIPGYIPQTWNPIVGCSKISEGCRNCYAERQAVRNYNCLSSDTFRSSIAHDVYLAYQNALQFDENPATQRTFGFSQARWSGFTFLLEETLKKPLGWKKPRAIFVNSMGDLFHENTPYEWIDRVFTVMALCPQHLFIVLTKRAERMGRYLSHHETAKRIYEIIPDKNAPRNTPIPAFESGRGGLRMLPNVWLGVTAENQAAADERIPHLLSTPAAVRFVSCEPLIGPVDLTRIKVAQAPNPLPCDPTHASALFDHGGNTETLDWIICGGESGPGARPMSRDWARSLRDQAQSAGVPFFFKQWGRFHGGYIELPCTHSDFLDGVQHHQWPEVK